MSNREVIKVLKNIKRFICKRNLKIFVNIRKDYIDVNIREDYIDVYSKSFETFL